MSLPRLAIDRWPLIPLRLIVGYGFMEHGFAKLAKDLLDGWTKPAPDMSSTVRETVAFRPSGGKLAITTFGLRIDLDCAPSSRLAAGPF
jgi:hypothetical protein